MTVDLASNVLDPQSLLATLGPLALLVVLFAETGLLLGFFLPGGSLLFTAGVLCSTTASQSLHLNLPTTLAAAAVGATLGAQLGHVIEVKAGRPLLRRHRGVRLQAAAARAETFLLHYGVGRRWCWPGS